RCSAVSRARRRRHRMCRSKRARHRPGPACRGCRAAQIGRHDMTATAPRRSTLPYIVLAAIGVSIVWGLYASGLATDMLRYKKDVVYLFKQHLVLVAISG